MFKKPNPEEQAAKKAELEQRQATKDYQAFLRGPVGIARAAYRRGDLILQYSQDVLTQNAVIVRMVGSTTTKSTNDPSEILNAICTEGWELVNGSFVFIAEGEESRDKFMASGQNVAVKGRTVGYYLFKRTRDSSAPDPMIDLDEAERLRRTK